MKYPGIVNFISSRLSDVLSDRFFGSMSSIGQILCKLLYIIIRIFLIIYYSKSYDISIINNKKKESRGDTPWILLHKVSLSMNVFKRLNSNCYFQ